MVTIQTRTPDSRSTSGQIWFNRLLKEFDGIESRLPTGFTLSDHVMDPASGVCKACFEASLTAPAGNAFGESGRPGEALDEPPVEGGVVDSGTGDAPPTAVEKGQAEGGEGGEGEGGDASEEEEDTSGGEGKIDGDAPAAGGDPAAEGSKEGVPVEDSLRFKVEMDIGLETRYPFESPVIRVLEGEDVIPSLALSRDLLTLPDIDGWTPSSTIVGTLQDIADMVLHAKEAGLPTGSGGDSQALERGDLRPGALVATEELDGCLFPCAPQAPASSMPILSMGRAMLAPRSSKGHRPLDRYVGLTDKQVLELEAHHTRLNQAVVLSAVSLTSLKKVKFRRGSSVTLVLKNGESSEYAIPQSYECVIAVTERLQKMGIAGHQTTAGAERQLSQARAIMDNLKDKEVAFGGEDQQEPSLAMVEECMDMFRQAAELYSAAGDSRHEEVLTHMHEFLQRPGVIAVLEKSPDGIEGEKQNPDSGEAADDFQKGSDSPAPAFAPPSELPEAADATDAADVGATTARDRAQSSPVRSAEGGEVVNTPTPTKAIPGEVRDGGRRASPSRAAVSGRAAAALVGSSSDAVTPAKPSARAGGGNSVARLTPAASSPGGKREPIGSSKSSRPEEGGGGPQSRGKGRGGRGGRGGRVRGGYSSVEKESVG